MANESLLQYYQDYNINPAPIALENEAAWKSHFAKRFNLYQRHLGIPLSLLRGRSVLEFGCNSGENSLVLASFGANLTLVEPNQQVLPRLKVLFKKFGFEKQIIALFQKDIDSFSPNELFDVVIVEGFLFSLPNRDKLIRKIAHLLAPYGLAVISFNDRYGCLLELTKRMLLWRICRLAKVDDVHSEASLKFARKLYGEDFERLDASRPFEVWWKDMLVNPLFKFSTLWSYQEILPLIEEAGCEFYSSSPKWTAVEHLSWYKNVQDRKNRHRRLLEDWADRFYFFLTGIPVGQETIESATSEVVKSVSDLAGQISEYTKDPTSSIELVKYPPLLDRYLKEAKDSRISRFNSEMRRLYDAVRSAELDDLLTTYKTSKLLRKLWGAPFHYICFVKLD